MEALRLTPPQPLIFCHEERVPQTSFVEPHISRKGNLNRPRIRGTGSKLMTEISSPVVTSLENAIVSSYNSSFSAIPSASRKKVASNSLQYPLVGM
ncbi:hypothetical protein HRI_000786600 [Hibiscus trionum]|uniref:Uncharacterized protein n=1 Tax=Hibiscus trionum TaxID=183268 RepID=A0A9W7H5Q4_HIBTR|nr:hypothetical protein HRI_000786600 [Hibiscus trionum]